MVVWTDPAKRDLKRIRDYIAADSNYYAKQAVQGIIAKTEKLNHFPEIGRMVPELEDPRIRELIFYSYRLVYEIKLQDIDILAIIHGKRDFLKAYQENDDDQ